MTKITKEHLTKMIKEIIKEQLNNNKEEEQVSVEQETKKMVSSLKNNLLPVAEKFFFELHDLKIAIKDSVTLDTMDAEGKINRASDDLRKLIKTLRRI